MKKNFLVTTGLSDEWELMENNFILGKWCELHKFDLSNQNVPKKNFNQIKVIKNTYHWESDEKKNKDFKYLKEKIEHLLDIISEKLSKIHNVNENKEYWRVVIYSWLAVYTITIYDRWEIIRTFFEKNKNNNFYLNSILMNDLDYIPKNHINFYTGSQTDEWNHLIFLRLISFLNIKNFVFIKKNGIKTSFKKNINFPAKKLPISIHIIKSIDDIISKFAFKFNKIIFESFHIPNKEYIKICFKNGLIPSKYSNFFDIDTNKKDVSISDKRNQLKDLKPTNENNDDFTKFLLLNLYKDMPKSYLEDFDYIKKKFLPFAKKKKIIFSMYRLFLNDNFKIYVAETKKVGSKFIYAEHGGGLILKYHPFFDFFEKVSDKIIRWHKTNEKKNIYVNLSPTRPIIKFKNHNSKGKNCTIVFCEPKKYLLGLLIEPALDQSINLFDKLTQFASGLKPEIKSKIKFRAKKEIASFDSEKKFSKIFGEKTIDKVSHKNSFEKAVLNSKLVIMTYPQTSFSEAMYSNVPTILVFVKNYWQFSKDSLNIFEDLKKNKIAFEDFNEAKDHVNKYWNKLDLWWKSENVQFARERFLKNFFNVKSNWYEEWSDYVNFSKKI